MTDPAENNAPLSDAEERELAEFTEAFRRTRPALSEDALGRVGDRVRSAARRRPNRSWLRLAAAACFLLATAASLWFWLSAGNPPPEPRRVVFDTVTLPYHPAPAPQPSTALLPIDEYRTLFSD